MTTAGRRKTGGKKRRGSPRGLPLLAANYGVDANLDGLHVFRLPAFGSLDDIELDRLAFLQAAEAVGLDSGEMHENIFPILAADESKSLGVVEPLNDSLLHGGTCVLLD